MSQLAFVIREKGAQPQVTPVSVPKLEAGEVLVKILAAAVNPYENLTITIGLFAESFPYIMGTDGAGVIEEIGPGVTNVKKGDIVAMQGDVFNSSTATFQQYAKTEAQLITRVPPSISVEQAASIPVTITAAFVGLYHSTGLGLTPPWTTDGMGKYVGQTIFISGGSGGIGRYAIQLAKLSGFTIIATAREENRALVASLGATHIFPRGTPAQEIRSAIGPIKLGFDVVSTAETQAFSLEVLDKADDTTLIIVTHPTEATKNNAAPINVRLIIGISARTKDISMPFWATVERWLADGSIKPGSVEVMPGGLEAVSEALDRLKRGTASGKKLVIKPQETDGVGLKI